MKPRGITWTDSSWFFLVVAVLILFLSGIQLVSLGVIGEYLWRAVEEVRKRPHYLVEKRLPREGAQPDGR